MFHATLQSIKIILTLLQHFIQDKKNGWTSDITAYRVWKASTIWSSVSRVNWGARIFVWKHLQHLTYTKNTNGAAHRDTSCDRSLPFFCVTIKRTESFIYLIFRMLIIIFEIENDWWWGWKVWPSWENVIAAVVVGTQTAGDKQTDVLESITLHFKKSITQFDLKNASWCADDLIVYSLWRHI